MSPTSRLASGLSERFQRILNASIDSYGHEVRYLRDFVLSSPQLRAAIGVLDGVDINPEEWIDTFDRRNYSWPPTEIARTKILWHVVGLIADADDPWKVAEMFSDKSHLVDALRDMTLAVVEPMVGYLIDSVDTGSEVLYLLNLYRRRVAWFQREELHLKYSSNPEVGEANYDGDLRRFLLDHGVPYPFSQPASASGRTDIVSGIEADDCLVCEIKLYGGLSNYGIANLARGVHQAVEYAKDYGKTVAYLVIFNLSEDHLLLPSEGTVGQWPPWVNFGGVVLYFIVVDALPLPGASTRGKAHGIEINKDQLWDTT